jgi:hypothetical protein
MSGILTPIQEYPTIATISGSYGRVFTYQPCHLFEQSVSLYFLIQRVTNDTGDLPLVNASVIALASTRSLIQVHNVRIRN